MKTTSLLVFCAASAFAFSAQAERCVFTGDFAPQEGFVKTPEAPLRRELCLNGPWRFQPMPLPAGYEWDKGVVPELPPPADDKWETTPIKIPSPWNANNWGGAPKTGPGTDRPYGPDSVYYPSYPEHWIHPQMAWMERAFRVPEDWPENNRLVLHFESVAGECQIWVNGQKVGENFDKYLPFDVDVTEAAARGRDNTLRVGVRSYRLFDKRDVRYTKMTAPYPNGSNTDRLSGIWQDVSLVSLPAVRVTDVFVKPWLDRDALEADVTLRNDTDQPRTVALAAEVSAWVNEAGASVLDAPVPKWRLGAACLSFPGASVQIAPHGTATATLAVSPAGRLKTWSPDAPNLHALLVRLSADGAPLDTKFQRFGWRQFTFKGRDLLLNGERIQLRGDIIHPFGAYVFSRRFVWAWYTMIKDMHGNAVRPHAQPYPRCYAELADELGICVLDEAAVFGSSIRSNFAEPEFWTRYADHFKRLILRDRNNPSVMGWSFGNEMFAIFRLNEVAPEDEKRWYAQLAQTGLDTWRQNDPTRPWLSCDGDEDLSGALPVWSKHYGHNLPPLAEHTRGIGKPLMVGENGGTYYARPAELAPFAGERAFRDYAGRNDALGVDIYQNIVQMARPNLAYFSASETVWFGLAHLPFGVSDFTRVPALTDGVFFEGVPQEGKFGMQVERLPPYTGTLNPGFDPALPLYRPLAMFEAQKAAQDPRGPQPCPVERSVIAPPAQLSSPRIDAVAYAGGPALRARLAAWGVHIDDAATRLLVLDGGALPADAKARVDQAVAAGGHVLILAGGAQADADAVSALLPEPVAFTAREATALECATPEPAPFRADTLYFAEEEPPANRRVMRRGMGGPFVQNGRVVLTASRTDWTLFNRRSEEEKVGAICCYEALVKPEGAALVSHRSGAAGVVTLCTIDPAPDSPAHRALWQRLFACLSVNTRPPQPAADGQDAKRAHDLLLDGPQE
ncbi:MAG: beta-galactosidase [Verrucomicrobiota bacterium]|jgi:beta-galactosidase|nr:beta-galactosidase [Verrucomicrobiota bacterium]